MAKGAGFFYDEVTNFSRMIRAAVDLRDRTRRTTIDWRGSAMRMMGRGYRERFYSARLGRYNSRRFYKNTLGVV